MDETAVTAKNFERLLLLNFGPRVRTHLIHTSYQTRT